MDVVDGAVDVLDNLDKNPFTSRTITSLPTLRQTSMVQARSPYSVLRLAAGGGPNVRLVVSLGPEYILTPASFNTVQMSWKKLPSVEKL